MRVIPVYLNGLRIYAYKIKDILRTANLWNISAQVINTKLLV